MLAADMRREAGTLVKESSRNRSCAAASRLALAMSRIAYEARMSTVACLWVEVSRPMGTGGASHEDRVWLSWLRSAGRFEGYLPILSHWHCVRRRSSVRSPRLLQGHITVSTATLTCGTSAVTWSTTTTLTRGIMPSNATTPTVAIATSRADRAGMPAWRKCRHGALPTAMPALHQAALPAAWPIQADTVRRAWLPKRAAISAVNRPHAPESRARASLTKAC